MEPRSDQKAVSRAIASGGTDLPQTGNGEGEPEFSRAHAERDKQDRERDQERADVGEELSKKRHDAEDKRRLHADQPHPGANRKSGHDSVDCDTAHPGSHLSPEAGQGAVRLHSEPVGCERQITGDQRLRVAQHKNEQQQGKDHAEHAADDTDCRS